MHTYLVFEIGKSAYAEFKMKSGEFAPTDDAILVDEVQATSKEDAILAVLNSEKHEDKVFYSLIARRVL
jgi:hypothetical protein